MLIRFCLYGFLKNQRYFEPFFVLALLEKGLTFTWVGLLVAFREALVLLLEIPSGALADLFGRRRAMILSFASYVVSFSVFAFADSMPALFGAMAAFAVGDVFRSGTHKAMIFAWLKQQGRTDERTRIYGLTRSWSKFGSAVSSLIAAAFVVVSGGYEAVFLFALVPYVLSIVNFLGYPSSLDGERKPASFGSVMGHSAEVLKTCARSVPLRGLMFESMGFEGVFHAVKDYLQPVLVTAAVIAFLGTMPAEDPAMDPRAAILVGLVYFVLNLLSGFASRRAHKFVDRAGTEARAASLLWGIVAIVFSALLASTLLGWFWLTIASFIALFVVQNLWRPVLVSRIDSYGEERQGATLMSVESQARRLGTMALAPLLGLAVDTAQKTDPGGGYWPVGLVGCVVAVVFFSRSRLLLDPVDSQFPQG